MGVAGGAPAMDRLRESMAALVRELLQLALLGLLVGLACWPFNLLDRAQDRLLGLLPIFSGRPWSPLTLALASSPVLVVPLLLLLLQGAKNLLPAKLLQNQLQAEKNQLLVAKLQQQNPLQEQKQQQLHLPKIIPHRVVLW